jgi:RimJ/RimL family protein N-acetyltransferase
MRQKRRRRPSSAERQPGRFRGVRRLLLSMATPNDCGRVRDIKSDIPTSVSCACRSSLELRPIAAPDRSALAAAFANLSPESRLRRFLGPKSTLSASELTYLTDLDHVTHEALAAVNSRGEIVGVARYAAWPSARRDTAELAVAVIDSCHRRGIGSALVRAVIERAEANGFVCLTASALCDNFPARALITQLGFRRAGIDHGIASYRLELPGIRALALAQRGAEAA